MEKKKNFNHKKSDLLKKRNRFFPTTVPAKTLLSLLNLYPERQRKN